MEMTQSPSESSPSSAAPANSPTPAITILSYSANSCYCFNNSLGLPATPWDTDMQPKQKCPCFLACSLGAYKKLMVLLFFLRYSCALRCYDIPLYFSLFLILLFPLQVADFEAASSDTSKLDSLKDHLESIC